MTTDHAIKMAKVQMLLEQLKSDKFPELGKVVGDFVLYDSLLAGAAASVVQFSTLPLADVPTPDAETLRKIDELRGSTGLSNEDREFLKYFDHLGELQTAIIACVQESPPRATAQDQHGTGNSGP